MHAFFLIFSFVSTIPFVFLSDASSARAVFRFSSLCSALTKPHSFTACVLLRPRSAHALLFLHTASHAPVVHMLEHELTLVSFTACSASSKLHTLVRRSSLDSVSVRVAFVTREVQRRLSHSGFGSASQ